jgi:hypothetical protein
LRQDAGVEERIDNDVEVYKPEPNCNEEISPQGVLNDDGAQYKEKSGSDNEK